MRAATAPAAACSRVEPLGETAGAFMTQQYNGNVAPGCYTRLYSTSLLQREWPQAGGISALKRYYVVGFNPDTHALAQRVIVVAGKQRQHLAAGGQAQRVHDIRSLEGLG